MDGVKGEVYVNGNLFADSSCVRVSCSSTSTQDQQNKGDASFTSSTYPIKSTIVVKLFINHVENSYIFIPGRYLQYNQLRRDFFDFFGIEVDHVENSDNAIKQLLYLLKQELIKKFNVPSNYKKLKKFKFPITYPNSNIKTVKRKFPSLKELIYNKLNDGDTLISFIVQPVLSFMGFSKNNNDKFIEVECSQNTQDRNISKLSATLTEKYTPTPTNIQRIIKIQEFAESLLKRNVAICNNSRKDRRQVMSHKWWEAMVSDFGSPER